VVIGVYIHSSSMNEMLVSFFQDTAISLSLLEISMNAVAALTVDDPYEYYATLARAPRLVWQGGMWVAASPALVTEVLAHAACRVRPLAEPVPAALAGGSAGEVFGALVRMNDGPAVHDVPKMALQRALAGVSADEVRAVAARVARETCDAAAAVTGGAASAAGVTQWMMETPVRTVASLLGFTDAQLPAVAAWMGRFVACLSPLSSAQQIASAHAASVELLAALRALMAAPGGLREGSLLQSVWCEAADAGWREERAILANLVGLMSQTHEATAGLIGNTLVALQRGAPWPSDAASALRLVREVAVNDPPVQNTRRFVAEDAHIGGVDVKQGQMILVVLAAAGKGFGHGAHACPGQAMAETIAAAAIAGLPAPPGPMRWRYRPSVNARIPEFVEVL
jgi:cytochrome P450